MVSQFHSLTVSTVTRGRAAAITLAATLALAGAAQAQTAAPAAAAPVYGPAVPGLCLLGQAQALGRSKVGISANQQLEQFYQQVQTELKTASDPIVADARALDAKKATLAQAEFQQEAAKLRQREVELNRLKNLRGAQLAYTRKQALEQVAKVLGPALTETITDHHCGAVFERSAAYAAAPGSDITAIVIQRMDAAVSSVSLQLAPPEAVERQPAPAQ